MSVVTAIGHRRVATPAGHGAWTVRRFVRPRL